MFKRMEMEYKKSPIKLQFDISTSSCLYSWGMSGGGIIPIQHHKIQRNSVCGVLNGSLGSVAFVNRFCSFGANEFSRLYFDVAANECRKFSRTQKKDRKKNFD